MSSILEIKNLKYADVFDDISFSIERNSINSVIGSNNCGKTALIRCLSTKIPLDGCIIYDNKLIKKKELKQYKNDINYCFYRNLESKNTVSSIITNNLKNDKYLIEKRINYFSPLFEINDLLNEKLSDLSTYEKVKVAIVSTIINLPKLVFFDDIFEEINYQEYSYLMDKLRQFMKDNDSTIIFTTNNLNNILLCDNVIVLNENKVFMQDSVSNVLSHDNELSKMGMNIPTMVDISLKLQFYGLIDEIIIDPERLVNILWK